MMKPKMTAAEALAALENMTDEDFPTADSSEDVSDNQVAQFIETGRRLSGRPSLTAPGTHSPQITLRLPASINEQLTQLAALNGKRRSDVIREALGEYLTSHAA